MKQENSQILISLIKIKKLCISEMEKSMTNLKIDDQVDRIYASMIQNQKIEVKVLNGIVKSEEKNNGNR